MTMIPMKLYDRIKRDHVGGRYEEVTKAFLLKEQPSKKYTERCCIL